MKAYDSNKTMLRYMLIAVAMAVVAVAVVVRAFYIMTAERSYWLEVKEKVVKDSVVIAPTRGNILSSNGQPMACNLPEYKIFMDFKALKAGKADTLWHDSLGNETKEFREICKGLHRIFPDLTEEHFRSHLKEGYDNNKAHWQIVKGRIDYTKYKKVKELPIFKLRSYTGGFHEESFMVRNRPYGSLAAIIVGDTYKESGKAIGGLELAYDTILKGKPGIEHRLKVLNRFISINDTSAIDGCDIVSTIDVGIQDLAERSLIKELKKDHAYTGVAIVMEVATGDIKAMVNMDLDPVTGEYKEIRNHAIADFLEPGSVFKTASMMAVFDDHDYIARKLGAPIDTNYIVDTQGGIIEMHGAKMRDHNWHRGGYGPITFGKIMQVSSNIGVSVIVEKCYMNEPERYVQRIHETGIGTNLHLPFPEYMPPRIRMPKKNDRGQWLNWSKTALPWMSIGYETNVPPISTLTFYNAIANNGKMVKPRFVTKVVKDGETIQEFPVEVIKERICGDWALSRVQEVLRKVVSVGLGKTAGSKSFQVSGKTGTAQKAHNGTYKGGGTVDYLLSFAGYFPSDNPKYSCIVCIQKSGLPASGGLMSGQVFHDIAEGIMAQNIFYNVSAAKDQTYVSTPQVKDGNLLAADYVLSRLGLSAEGGWNGSYKDGNPIWGKAHSQKSETTVVNDSSNIPHVVTTGEGKITFSKQDIANSKSMPDVTGMGARDAVFLLESRGVKVLLRGRGKVKHQSKGIGETLKKGERITLELA